MVKMNFTILWIFVFFCLSSKSNGGETISELELDMKLKSLNKPAVKSIQSEDGDIIDCVDIHKQPAFDHPALKNHTIQMKPSFSLPAPSCTTSNQTKIFQTWQKSGTCPDGTVPIRRIKKQDLLRAASLDQFGRKPSYNASTIEPQDISINNTKVRVYTQPNRSTAFLITVGYNYIGAKGDINVWSPNVDLPDDFTTGQIWLKAGPGNNFESVESGWTVNPKLYGDRLPRLFAYWTGDAYQKTGCFDLTCSGFIHTNPKVALGGSIQPWSSSGGQQYQITVEINMDTWSSNWWLRVQGEDIGYWPAASYLFYLNHSSTLVQWGGDVYSQNVKKTPHTKTAMGSGEQATTLWGNACFIQHVRIRDYSNTYKYPEWVGDWSEEPYCYGTVNLAGYTFEPVFYFGGAGGGGNIYCQ